MASSGITFFQETNVETEPPPPLPPPTAHCAKIIA